MEESRLKPFDQDYDKELFNKIYKETKSLRNKLAYGIDSNRFGVDYQEILSWFDVKFIYAYHKYHKQMDGDILKGHIINALRLFRCRILRKAYSQQNQVNWNNHDIDMMKNADSLLIDNSLEDTSELNHILTILKSKLSKESQMILEIELNTPEYISSRCTKQQRNTFLGIPSKLIAEYLDFKSPNLVEEYKQEIMGIISDIKQEYKIA